MNAIALKFTPESDDAPVVIASGIGYLGDKIESIAKSNDVPIIKNEFLSSVLVKLPIGEEIPEPLYRAVAAVFSFLYKLENELK